MKLRVSALALGIVTGFVVYGSSRGWLDFRSSCDAAPRRARARFPQAMSSNNEGVTNG